MATKQETQIETVKMDDGRVVDFPGKRQILKSSIIDEQAGTVAVRLDFRGHCPASSDPVVHDVDGSTAQARWVLLADLDDLPLVSTITRLREAGRL